MNERGLAAELFGIDDRRCKDRRMFTYSACLPERRICPDRRCNIPLCLVELEDEEIESLLEFRDELS